MSDTLPNGYTLLNWISYPNNSQTEQYKLILRNASEVDTIVMDFTSTNTSNADVFIGYGGSAGFLGYNSGTYMTLVYGYSGCTVTPILTNMQKGDGQRHVITFKYNSATGIISFGGYPSVYGAAKTLYRMSLYKGGILKNDFVPALRDSDGNVGLYDVVNAVFVANTGTETFLYEKAQPPAPAYMARYLIRAGEVLYTVREGVLTALAEHLPTAALFTAHGMEELPASDLLKTLANPAVLAWTDGETLPVLTAAVTGQPYPQTLEALVDMTDASILGIGSLTANYSGTVGVRYSADEKATFSEEVAVADFLNTDKEALFAAAETGRLWLEFSVYAGAKLTDFQIKFKN